MCGQAITINSRFPVIKRDVYRAQGSRESNEGIISFSRTFFNLTKAPLKVGLNPTLSRTSQEIHGLALPLEMYIEHRILEKVNENEISFSRVFLNLGAPLSLRLREGMQSRDCRWLWGSSTWQSTPKSTLEF
jgi:hypothetical protein